MAKLKSKIELYLFNVIFTWMVFDSIDWVPMWKNSIHLV